MECLALVDRGLTFQEALQLDAEERAAFLIVFGKLKGGTFNWTAGEWERPDA